MWTILTNSIAKDKHALGDPVHVWTLLDHVDDIVHVRVVSIPNKPR